MHKLSQLSFQLNVLIDSSGKAVLCDFGLSRIKADATSTAANPDGVRVVGSRNWMAPELLLGGSLKKPCDIYAFGMTMYEVNLNHIASCMSWLNPHFERFLRMKPHCITLTPMISSSWWPNKMLDRKDRMKRMLPNF
jgi:serine/threonine protein kinase